VLFSNLVHKAFPFLREKPWEGGWFFSGRAFREWTRESDGIEPNLWNVAR